MPRATNAVARRKRRKKVLDRAKGYYGRKHSSYRFANEQVMRSDAYAYRDRRQKKRDFRRLWITRINAAARLTGTTVEIFRRGSRVASHARSYEKYRHTTLTVALRTFSLVSATRSTS